MSTIYIGKQYEGAFNSMLKLCGGESPIFRDDRITGIRSDRITTASGNVYIYRDDIEGVLVEGGEEQAGSGAIFMGREGASWFEAIRQGNSSAPDSLSDWMNLITQVATGVHKRFAYLEFSQETRVSLTPEQEERIKDRVHTIAETFFRLGDIKVKEGSLLDGAESYYGATLKLEFTNAGASLPPILGKVYFQESGGNLVPVLRKTAEEINNRIQAVGDARASKKGSGKSEEDHRATVAKVDRAVGSLLSASSDSPFPFKDCLLLSSEEDEAIIREQTGRVELSSYAAKVNLTCTGVQLLGISHVRWLNRSYNVLYRGEPLLRATVGMDNAITLRCLHCNSAAPLLASNVLTYRDPEDPDRTLSAVLDPDDEFLGLGEERLDEILSHSEVSKHLFTVSCAAARSPGRKCSRVRCASDTVQFESGDTLRRYCKDCTMPEVLYRTDLGDRPTASLSFARDLMSMIPTQNGEGKRNVDTCEYCKRPFTSDGGVLGGRCSFCRRLDVLMTGDAGNEEKAEAAALFRRYASMLPHGARRKASGKKGYCIEEEDMILFACGDSIYAFDKVNLKTTGYLESPVKVK